MKRDLDCNKVTADNVNISIGLTSPSYTVKVQQNLDFLPEPWNGFGGIINYSKVDTNDKENILPGISPESYNLTEEIYEEYLANNPAKVRRLSPVRGDNLLFIGGQSKIPE